jgi:hypothetical protein
MWLIAISRDSSSSPTRTCARGASSAASSRRLHLARLPGRLGALLLTVRGFELHYGSTCSCCCRAGHRDARAVAGSFILGVYLFVSITHLRPPSNEAFSRCGSRITSSGCGCASTRPGN